MPSLRPPMPMGELGSVTLPFVNKHSSNNSQTLPILLLIQAITVVLLFEESVMLLMCTPLLFVLK